MTTLKLDLTDDAYTRLEQTAKAEGISVAALIRRALNLEAVVRDKKVYVRDAERGELRELQLA